MIFFDVLSNNVLWNKFIESETNENYAEGLNFLLKNNIKVLSVTTDGRKGVSNVFKDYPVQICQFYVQKRILSKTTINPKTECGKKLKYIATHFIKEKWNKERFSEEISKISIEFKDFLNEKNDENQYKHKKLRSALFGIKTVLPNLFTFQDYSELKIPNTTNHLDGGINTKIKDLVRRHRGMKISRRNKLIVNLLYNLYGFF